jgi:hypothetical protein
VELAVARLRELRTSKPPVQASRSEIANSDEHRRSLGDWNVDAPVLDQPAHRANIARFDFLDPRAGEYYPDYDGALSIAVALLRTEAGRNPHDKDLTDLIGELATQSEAFRVRWRAHDVRSHRGGVKTFNHPVVGHLELAYDSMQLVAAPGLVLTPYTAEPATASADALALLASWTVTDHAAPTETPDRDATGSHD